MFQHPKIKKVIPDGDSGESLRPVPDVVEARLDLPEPTPVIVQVRDEMETMVGSLAPILDTYPLRNQDVIITRSEYEAASLEARDYYGAIGQRWGNHPGWTYYHVSRNLLDDLRAWLPYTSYPDGPVQVKWQVTISNNTRRSLDRIKKLSASEWGQVAECFVAALLHGGPTGTQLLAWLGERERKLNKLLELLQVLYQVQVTDFHNLFRARRQLYRHQARQEGALLLFGLLSNKVSRVLDGLTDSLDFIPGMYECLDLREFENDVRGRVNQLLSHYIRRQDELSQGLQFQGRIDDESLVRLEKGKRLLEFINRVRTVAEILRDLQSYPLDRLDWKYEMEKKLGEVQSDPLLEPLRESASAKTQVNQTSHPKAKPAGLDQAGLEFLDYRAPANRT